MAHLAPALAPVAPATARLCILFIVSAHNSLSQRALVALRALGHHVTVEVVDSSAAVEAAVARETSELIVCPMLKTIIPDSVWPKHRCLIVHPGPVGDRGPSSLDWAIELGMAEWGVTVLEATGEVDGGDIWASRTFRTRQTGKSSLYRHEVRRAAVSALQEAMANIADAGFRPRRDRAAPAARRRGPPGRAGRRRGRRVPPVRRPPRARAARAPRRDHRPAARRDLPRDGRR